MSIHELSLIETTPGERRGRALTAALLRLLSRALGLLAERVAPAPRTPVLDAVVEFHADAGAPEGALYINGELVGHVLGVQRL